MPISLRCRPIFGHLQQLFAHVRQVELTLAHLLGDACSFFGVDIGRGFLDQRDHVAHAENCGGDFAGMEIFQRVGLFTGAINLIGLPVTARIEQRRAAAAIAVTRVSTMPVRPTRSSNDRARLTAS